MFFWAQAAGSFECRQHARRAPPAAAAFVSAIAPSRCEIISKLNFMVHYLPLRHWSNGILNGTDLICVGLASQLRCYLVLIIR